MYDRIKYFRRRQFVFGPEYINYEGWKKVNIDDKYMLTIHPDLRMTIVEVNENKAVLLGYVIDPYNHELNEEDILRFLIKGDKSLKDITSGLDKLSGRFILIVKFRKGLWLFPDTCALRSVNYCRDNNGEIWCASQAEVLAERFGFEYDEEVISYRDIPKYRLSKEEFWLINDRTPYCEIRYLLANHYLDLYAGEVFRFWPVAGCIDSHTMDESVVLCTPILQHSIKAASQRFDLKMGITAGSDSRRSLAASRDVKKNIYYFTHTPRSNNADSIIPALLLPKLGIEHHNHDIKPMSHEFREYYERSSTWARERRGQIAYTALCNFGPDATVLNSDKSEVHECWYWLPANKITGEGLAVATNLNHTFAIKEFQKWIDGAKTACESARMNILVLFDLELRSRWVAEAYSEYDIAYDTFTPYNNRYLFSLELSFHERYRRRQLTFLIKHIKYMWPEVLTEPINPPTKILEKMEQFMQYSIIHKIVTPFIPIYDYLRYVKLRWDFHRSDKYTK